MRPRWLTEVKDPLRVTQAHKEQTWDSKPGHGLRQKCGSCMIVHILFYDPGKQAS